MRSRSIGRSRRRGHPTTPHPQTVWSPPGRLPPERSLSGKVYSHSFRTMAYVSHMITRPHLLAAILSVRLFPAIPAELSSECTRSGGTVTAASDSASQWSPTRASAPSHPAESRRPVSKVHYSNTCVTTPGLIARRIRRGLLSDSDRTPIRVLARFSTSVSLSSVRDTSDITGNLRHARIRSFDSHRPRGGSEPIAAPETGGELSDCASWSTVRSGYGWMRDWPIDM